MQKKGDSMEKLVLIDGNSLLNRAYYATPAFTNKEGFPTNAIFGFVKLLLKIVSDKKPQYMAVAFDLHAPTFRHALYVDYKAGRKPMPDDLRVQVPALKELLSLMKITTCELEGYEADDIIGTLSKRFDVKTFIYTGDRDAYQLVDETTNVCFTKRGVSEILELSKQNFQDEIGLSPCQIIDLKALMGDASDHIPGVAGIGEKTARNLIAEYGSIDDVYAHVEEIKGAVQKKLIEGKESAYFSYKLATIDTNCPIQTTLSDCVFHSVYSQSVRAKFSQYDFKSLVELPIFEEEEKTASNDREKVETAYPSTVAEGVAFLEKSEAQAVGVYFSKKVLHVGLKFETGFVELVFPVKEDLLSVGFYIEELVPLFECLFTGQKRLVTFDLKGLLHSLSALSLAPTVRIEDLALMKYIVDGQGGNESLDYALDYASISSEECGVGIIKLFEHYALLMNEAEKKLYEEIELPLVYVLFDMEKFGVCADVQIIDTLSNKYNAEIKDLTNQIYALAGETFNINSPVQLGKILFEKLGIGRTEQGKSKTKKGYSTSADVLEQFKDESEIVRLVLRYRQIQKLVSTYLEGFKPLIQNGKVHTTYNQTVTSTGRLSSSNPNLQNIPVRTDEGRELRKIFKASDGCVLIDADYSQIELRLLAHISDCEPLKEAYNERKDIHTSTASLVFNVPEEEVTASLRREAKAVNFGIIYGISPFGLSKDLGISAKKAKEYIDRYFEKYPEVKTYMTDSVNSAKEKGYVQTIFGRKRIIPELKSSNFNLRAFGERAAMNMPLQGSSADIIKIAMINVFNCLKTENLKAKLVLQVHDELIIDSPKEEEERVREILKREMEAVVALRVPLVADVGTGNSWFDAH